MIPPSFIDEYYDHYYLEYRFGTTLAAELPSIEGQFLTSFDVGGLIIPDHIQNVSYAVFDFSWFANAAYNAAPANGFISFPIENNSTIFINFSVNGVVFPFLGMGGRFNKMHFDINRGGTPVTWAAIIHQTGAALNSIPQVALPITGSQVFLYKMYIYKSVPDKTDLPGRRLGHQS